MHTVDREKEMSVYQDWESVWPNIRTFHPSVVPLPVRQGHVQLKNQVHPHKKGNVELMKIPNFLHLTPPVVSKQCRILKEKFCTPWPGKKHDDDDAVRSEFPTVETTSSYLNASSSIRDHRARVVSLSVPLTSLRLTAQSREKFVRLSGDKYDPVSDSVTIVADHCPYLRQNSDYASYLLTALYFESCKREAWEETAKTEKDMVEYSWSLRPARSTLEEHLKSVQVLLNEGENEGTLGTYKKAVEGMMAKQGGTAASVE